MIFENKELSNKVEITIILHKFYESLFQKQETKLKHSQQQILEGLNLPRLSNNEKKTM